MAESEFPVTGEKKQTTYAPASDTETARNQNDTVESRAGGAEGVTSDNVLVLPGTGGPDDTGDIEMDPDEYFPKGDARPGHPTPWAPQE